MYAIKIACQGKQLNKQITDILINAKDLSEAKNIFAGYFCEAVSGEAAKPYFLNLQDSRVNQEISCGYAQFGGFHISGTLQICEITVPRYAADYDSLAVKTGEKDKKSA